MVTLVDMHEVLVNYHLPYNGNEFNSFFKMSELELYFFIAKIVWYIENTVSIRIAWNLC